MKCRYCEKELATQADYDAFQEGEGEHLCWSDFAQPCIDAEEALDIARARIVELEAMLAACSAESICDQIKSNWRDVLTDHNGSDWNRGYNEALMVCVDIVRQNAEAQTRREAT